MSHSNIDLVLRQKVYHQQPIDVKNKLLARIRDNKQTRYIIQNNIRTIAYAKAIRKGGYGIYPNIINTLMRKTRKHKHKQYTRKKKFKGGKINFYNTKTNKFSGGNIMGDIKIIHNNSKGIY